MKRLFKILVLIVAMGLILMLIINIIKSIKIEPVKIEEIPSIPATKAVKEKKEIKRETTKTIEKTERRDVEKEEPAEPVKEVSIISIPKVKKEETAEPVKEIPKIVEASKTERREVEKEKITVTEPEPEPAEETNLVEDAQDIEEISGLITEKTMTKTGYEFYENFCILWEAPEGIPKEIKDYNISISEKANPTWGSWIQVEVNAKMTPIIVWSKVVRPRSEEVREAAKKAVEATKEYLYRYEEYQEELGSDMVGDGIY